MFVKIEALDAVALRTDGPDGRDSKGDIDLLGCKITFEVFLGSIVEYRSFWVTVKRVADTSRFGGDGRSP